MGGTGDVRRRCRDAGGEGPGYVVLISTDPAAGGNSLNCHQSIGAEWADDSMHLYVQSTQNIYKLSNKQDIMPLK